MARLWARFPLALFVLAFSVSYGQTAVPDHLPELNSEEVGDACKELITQMGMYSSLPMGAGRRPGAEAPRFMCYIPRAEARCYSQGQIRRGGYPVHSGSPKGLWLR
jgi:hypothetical protein